MTESIFSIKNDIAVIIRSSLFSIFVMRVSWILDTADERVLVAVVGVVSTAFSPVAASASTAVTASAAAVAAATTFTAGCACD
jgi:hypothetical protein